MGTHAHSLDEVRAISGFGLEVAELWLDSEEFSTAEGQQALVELADAQGSEYTAHAPKEKPENARELEAMIPEAIGLAAAVGVKMLTLHPWLDPRFCPPELIEYKVDLLTRLDAIAAAHDVQLLIENCSEEPEHFEEALERVPGVGITLDTGHAELYAARNKCVPFVERWGQRIAHVHLNDNRGGSTAEDDIHLGLGEGVVDFAPIADGLREMGYNGLFVLEIAPEDIEKSKAIWTALWGAR